jgi:acetolactate synthase-1/2/3 large subunit
MLGGMSAAYLEAYAPVCIAENYDGSAAPERLHKRLDQHAMAGPVSEGLYSLLDLDNLPAVLARQTQATRPLYIELSKAASNVARQDSDLPLPTSHADLRTFLDSRLAGAPNVVVIVGSIAKRRGWTSLVDALQIPVFTTAQGKGTIDETKPNAAGVYTGTGGSMALESSLLPAADLVVTVGLRNGEILGPAGKKEFVNFDVPHRQATAHDVIAGEDELRRVLTRLADLPAWGTDLIEDQRRRWDAYVNSHEWMPGQVFEALDAIESPHALVLDTGTFCTIGEHGWHARPGREFLGSSNGRNLGLGVPHALGAACAKPGLPIFCALGDGGIRYYLAEMRTIAALGLPVCFILMTDGRYGSIAANVAGEADPDIVKPLGTSWCAVMKAMGLQSGRADDAVTFREMLTRWDRKTPCYIEASFDPDTYLHVADEIRA